jgi:peptidoglycan/LPS O-acetylase OafA/YrhL
MNRLAQGLVSSRLLRPRSRDLASTGEHLGASDSVRQQMLGDVAHGRDNNLDFLRFAAASLVVVSHSYPLAYGTDQWEPLGRLTSNTTLGSAAVWIFFVLSGFLVASSFERSHSVRDYVLARALRILPALTVVAVLTALVFGAVLTNLSLGQYFGDRSTYTYVFWGVVYAGKQYTLPGVFTSGNPFGPAINGSLWTLVYEMLFYVVVLVLGVTRRLRPWSVCALVILAWYPELWLTHSTFLARWFASTGDLFKFFGMGVLLYVIRDRVPLSGRLAALCAVLLFVAGWKQHPMILPDMAAIVGPYLMLWLAYQRHVRVPRFGRFGDFSYGMYIYAFPIQQLAAHIFYPDVRAWKIFVLSYPIILALSILSWHLVERPALRLRRRLSRSVNPTAGATATPRADVLGMTPNLERPV